MSLGGSGPLACFRSSIRERSPADFLTAGVTETVHGHGIPSGKHPLHLNYEFTAAELTQVLKF